MRADPGRQPYQLRLARDEDRPALERLIAQSVRTLGAPDYPAEQIEAALGKVFGVDIQLIEDGTYWVAEGTEAGADSGARVLLGCGGWSFRKTLFGASAQADADPASRDPSLLDPATDAARIRAFFVAPSCARRGVGRALLERCEAEAWRAGFRRFELMATLTGVALYRTRGYRAGAPGVHALAPGVEIAFVPMHRDGPWPAPR